MLHCWNMSLQETGHGHQATTYDLQPFSLDRVYELEYHLWQEDSVGCCLNQDGHLQLVLIVRGSVQMIRYVSGPCSSSELDKSRKLTTLWASLLSELVRFHNTRLGWLSIIHR